MADNKIAEMYVEIKAKTDKLDADINAIKNKISTDAKNLGVQAGTNISTGLKGALNFAGAIGAFTLFTAAIKGALTQAFEAARAFTQVNQAVKQTGGAAGITSKELVGIANNLEKITATDADDILQNITLQLLTFTNISGEAFKRAQVAALDLSAVLGTDLKGQTIQLAKALENPVQGITALSRAGVTFTEQQKEQIKTMVESGNLFGAQSLILDEINAKYGGQAELLKDTDGGFKKLNVTINNVAQSIGEDLVGSAESGTGAITELASAFDELNSSAKELTGKGVFGNIIDGIAALGTLGGSVLQQEFKKGYQKALKQYKIDLEDARKKTVDTYKSLGLGKTESPITPLMPKDVKNDDDKTKVQKTLNVAEQIHANNLQELEDIKILNKALENKNLQLIERIRLENDLNSLLEKRSKEYPDINPLTTKPEISQVPEIQQVNQPENPTTFNDEELQKNLKLIMESGAEFENKMVDAFYAVQDIGSILNVGADTFVGKLLSGLNDAVSLANSIISIIGLFTEVGSGGVFGLVGGLFGHSGGTFQDGRKIASFATGGSFIVPPGFPNDSFPLLVESGERVQVTPRSAVNGNNDSEYLKAVVGRLDALNMNIINNRPIVNNNVNVEGIKFTKKVVNPANEKIRTSGYKEFNEYGD